MYPITKKAAAVTTEMPAENGANIRLIMPNKYINAERDSIILPLSLLSERYYLILVQKSLQANYPVY